jgi:hypothetical protein
VSAWLDPLRAALDHATTPRTMFFRDDDAGWEDDRLLRLLDHFAGHGVPVDVAAIPAALGNATARALVDRAAAAHGRLRVHQHGCAHRNHEPTGRKYEFGPRRSARRQRADICAGRAQLQMLLGPIVDPIFTPPWNRCTRVTAQVLLDLGFAALSRDAGAAPFGLGGLAEVPVHVDWVRHAREGTLGRALAAGAQGDGPLGIMLHHAVMDESDFARLDTLLALVARHPRVACVPMRALLRPVPCEA